jgi:hypothetical protein
MTRLHSRRFVTALFRAGRHEHPGTTGGFLRGELRPSRHDYNLVAVALNEYLTDIGVGQIAHLPRCVVIQVGRDTRHGVLVRPIGLPARPRPIDAVAQLDAQPADVTARAVSVHRLRAHVVRSSQPNPLSETVTAE